MSKSESIFRVNFLKNNEQYEIYARGVSDCDLFNFVEIDDIIFNSSGSNLVVNTSEEKLRDEFENVKRFYLPMHTILRIDEVTKGGENRVRDITTKSNVSHFPNAFPQPSKTDE